MSGNSFDMPAIAPAPSGTDAEQHYQGVLSQLQVSIEENSTNEGLTIGFSPPTDQNVELFATNPAQALYVPPGTTIAIGPAAGFSGLDVEVTAPADAGALVLERIGRKFVRGLDQPGLPNYGYVVYNGVEESTVRAALEPVVKGLPLAELEAKWLEQSSVSRSTLESNYLDRFIQGGVYLAVDRGQSLGRPAQEDATDPNSDREFGFRMVTPQNGNGSYTELRPLPLLRAIAGSDPTRYAGHPLVAEAGSIQGEAVFHVGFELWDPDASSGTPSLGYVPLDSGVEVALMVDDFASDTEVATATTNADGAVEFTVSDPDDALGDAPNVYFLVRTQERQQAGHNMPEEWSTKGWVNRDGTPGLLESYVGTQFGTQAAPVTYGIGVDYHFEMRFRNPRSNALQNLPPGMTAEVGIESLPPLDEIHERHPTTASRSRADGVIFDIDPGDTLYLQVPAHVVDADIGLGMSVFWNPEFDRFIVPDNHTFDLSDPLGTDYTPRIHQADIEGQSIGTYTSPRQAVAKDSGATAVYFLKLGYELCTFFSLMTNGTWRGLEGITITPFAPANAFSWPEGFVWIDDGSFDERGTIIHELTHQVLWRELDIDELDVEALAVKQMSNNWLRNVLDTLDTDIGDALGMGDTVESFNHILHSSDLLGNPYNSLIEGWPYFVSGLFASGQRLPNPSIVGPNTQLRRIDELMSNVSWGSGSYDLGPPPKDRGESVEGAFTNAMSLLFQEEVLAASSFSFPLIPEPSDHDITEDGSGNPTWVTDATVQQRFREVIWEPLLALRGVQSEGEKDATRLLEETRNMNPYRWHDMAATLQSFNIANDDPEVDTVSPQGVPAGATPTSPVTITGDNFVAGRTSVLFGSASSPSVTVTSSTELTAEVPPRSSAGSVDLTVSVEAETPSGSSTWNLDPATINGGFTYT